MATERHGDRSAHALLVGPRLTAGRSASTGSMKRNRRSRVSSPVDQGGTMFLRALKLAIAGATMMIGSSLLSGNAVAVPALPGPAAAIGQSVGSGVDLVRHRSWHRPKPHYRTVRVCRTNWYHGRKITRCHWERRLIRYR
jgi:hypothetical protein